MICLREMAARKSTHPEVASTVSIFQLDRLIAFLLRSLTQTLVDAVHQFGLIMCFLSLSNQLETFCYKNVTFKIILKSYQTQIRTKQNKLVQSSEV